MTSTPITKTDAATYHPATRTPLRLESADGTVELTPTDQPGRTRVTLHPSNATLYVPQSSCETTLPPHVIERFLARSFSHLCELLARHEPADEIHTLLTRQLRAYEGEATLAGARILDFGCGAGASTVCLAQQYPAAEIIGIDLDASLVTDAAMVVMARGITNARVLTSPAAAQLPSGIGQFDIIVLSAVYEHLLPDERRVLMPMLWRAIRPGGRLYLSQTPYRYFPYEHHSTGLWFINYVPDGLAHWLARRFARLNPVANARRTWPEHLRGGIRGGTEWEVLRDLRLAHDGEPEVLTPLGSSRARYWLSGTSPRHRAVKRVVAALFTATDRLFGTVPSLNLDMVVRKAPHGVVTRKSS